MLVVTGGQGEPFGLPGADVDDELGVLPCLGRLLGASITSAKKMFGDFPPNSVVEGIRFCAA